MVFDKTGTLTRGEFSVVKVESVGMSERELMVLTAAAESHSNHPIARSICDHAGDIDSIVTDHRHIAGKGVTATVDGRSVAVGSASLMESMGISGFRDTDEIGTHVHVSVDGAYAGHILISDVLKDDSKDAVAELRGLGIRTCMLTGDGRVIGRIAEFQGNSEVLQLNCLKWTGLEGQLSDSSGTWIRSPFGILTEITLPIDDMRDNEYVLNAAQLRLSTAVTPSSKYKPSVPSTLLLIRKDKMQEFFAKNNTADKTESAGDGVSAAQRLQPGEALVRDGVETRQERSRNNLQHRLFLRPAHLCGAGRGAALRRLSETHGRRQDGRTDAEGRGGASGGSRRSPLIWRSPSQ